MGFKFNVDNADNLLSPFFDKYDIYAPKRFPKQGRYSDTDIVRYAKIKSIKEIEFSQKSDYSAKEVLTPINETLFYFIENEFKESTASQKRFCCLPGPVISMRFKFKAKFMKKMVSFLIFIFQELKII